jgi:transcriptional regulator with XRE-family HTH domain
MIEKSKKSKLVGEFIRQRREALKLSQRALGQLFDPPVTTQFISNVERGVTPLPPAHIAILAKALLINETELMGLLEQEYVLKLNGQLGRNGEPQRAAAGAPPPLVVDQADYDLIKSLYTAYRTADPQTKQAFFTVCESILKLPKEIFSNSSNK